VLSLDRPGRTNIRLAPDAVGDATARSIGRMPLTIVKAGKLLDSCSLNWLGIQRYLEEPVELKAFCRASLPRLIHRLFRLRSMQQP
jgi:hypothetical protein